MPDRPEPITWQALELMKSRVETIRIADGFYTDLGLGVVTLDTGLDANGESMALIYATTIPLEDNGTSRVVQSAMDAVVEFYIPFSDDDVAERIAHRARADLVRVLREPLRGKTPGIRAMKVTGSEIGSPEEVAGLVVARVTVQVDLNETPTA